jgi:hypothetical protein
MSSVSAKRLASSRCAACATHALRELPQVAVQVRVTCSALRGRVRGTPQRQLRHVAARPTSEPFLLVTEKREWGEWTEWTDFVWSERREWSERSVHGDYWGRKRSLMIE